MTWGTWLMHTQYFALLEVVCWKIMDKEKLNWDALCKVNDFALDHMCRAWDQEHALLLICNFP